MSSPRPSFSLVLHLLAFNRHADAFTPEEQDLLDAVRERTGSDNRARFAGVRGTPYKQEEQQRRSTYTVEYMCCTPTFDRRENMYYNARIFPVPGVRSRWSQNQLLLVNSRLKHCVCLHSRARSNVHMHTVAFSWQSLCFPGNHHLVLAITIFSWQSLSFPGNHYLSLAVIIFSWQSPYFWTAS